MSGSTYPDRDPDRELRLHGKAILIGIRMRITIAIGSLIPCPHNLGVSSRLVVNWGKKIDKKILWYTCFFTCHWLFVLGFSHLSKQLLRLSHPCATKIQVQAILRKVNDKRNQGETCGKIQKLTTLSKLVKHSKSRTVYICFIGCSNTKA